MESACVSKSVDDWGYVWRASPPRRLHPPFPHLQPLVHARQLLIVQGLIQCLKGALQPLHRTRAFCQLVLSVEYCVPLLGDCALEVFLLLLCLVYHLLQLRLLLTQMVMVLVLALLQTLLKLLALLLPSLQHPLPSPQLPPPFLKGHGARVVLTGRRGVHGWGKWRNSEKR